VTTGDEDVYKLHCISTWFQGRIQDFKLGDALKKIAPSGVRRENFWGISCEKSRFYAKKSYFFPIAEGGAKNFGVFRVKNHDYTPKNHIFSNFRGGACRVRLPLDPPLQSVPITTKVVSSNPVHSEVYSIQHYVIKFVSDL
jgi:hypothetical protein